MKLKHVDKQNETTDYIGIAATHQICTRKLLGSNSVQATGFLSKSGWTATQRPATSHEGLS